MSRSVDIKEKHKENEKKLKILNKEGMENLYLWYNGRVDKLNQKRK